MGNITLGRYIPLDSPIHRMDPRAKIGAMLLVLIAIFFPAGWLGYGIIFAAVSIVIFMSHLNVGYIWKSMKPMLIMLVFLLIKQKKSVRQKNMVQLLHFYQMILFLLQQNLRLKRF